MGSEAEPVEDRRGQHQGWPGEDFQTHSHREAQAKHLLCAWTEQPVCPSVILPPMLLSSNKGRNHVCWSVLLMRALTLLVSRRWSTIETLIRYI